MAEADLLLDTKSIQAMSDAHEYARGEEYCQRGRVRNLIREDGVYRAYVHRASYYLVKVWSDGGRVRTSCSCNYSKSGVCRHTVATMIMIVKRETAEVDTDDGINLYEDGSFVIPDVHAEPSGTGKALEEIEEGPPASVEASVLVARDVMSSPVATLPRDATIAQAWHFVQSRDVRHVPIVDEAGTIIGVISDRDLLRDAVSDAITHGSKPLTKRLVRDLVHSRLLTAGPDTDIAQIARVLFEEHVGSLPVIDEQQTLIGLITRSDILKAIVEGGLFGE